MALDVPLYDYAYGGAWAEDYLESGPFVPPGLGAQVNMYLVKAMAEKTWANHLYVFWAGSKRLSQWS